MDGPKKRRWFQLHLSTLLVLLVELNLIIFLNVANQMLPTEDDQFWIDPNEDVYVLKNGWLYGFPMSCCFKAETTIYEYVGGKEGSRRKDLGKVTHWRWANLSINILCGLGFLLVSTMSIEWATRRRKPKGSTGPPP